VFTCVLTKKTLWKKHTERGTDGNFIYDRIFESTDTGLTTQRWFIKDINQCAIPHIPGLEISIEAAVKLDGLGLLVQLCVWNIPS